MSSPALDRRGAHAPVRRALAGVAIAVGLLTIVPVPGGGRAAISDGAPWFAAVGALVGALCGGVLVLAEPAFGPFVAATLAVVVLVLATGALHQDGLADCADSLGARGGRELRLAVMRDPDTGVYGTLALLGWGLLIVGALATLDKTAALHALITAGAAGRWAALLHAGAAPAARRDGLGAAFAVSRPALAFATACAAGVALLVNPPLHGLAALGASLLVAAAVTGWSRAALGGRTGDTLGATVALGELAVCLMLLALATP